MMVTATALEEKGGTCTTIPTAARLARTHTHEVDSRERVFCPKVTTGGDDACTVWLLLLLLQLLRHIVCSRSLVQTSVGTSLMLILSS